MAAGFLYNVYGGGWRPCVQRQTPPSLPASHCLSFTCQVYTANLSPKHASPSQHAVFWLRKVNGSPLHLSGENCLNGWQNVLWGCLLEGRGLFWGDKHGEGSGPVIICVPDENVKKINPVTRSVQCETACTCSNVSAGWNDSFPRMMAVMTCWQCKAPSLKYNLLTHYCHLISTFQWLRSKRRPAICLSKKYSQYVTWP